MPTPRRRRHDTAASPTQPTHADIARRAYEIFLARGGQNGADLADWLQAEAELIQPASAELRRPSKPPSRRRAAGGRHAAI